VVLLVGFSIEDEVVDVVVDAEDEDASVSSFVSVVDGDVATGEVVDIVVVFVVVAVVDVDVDVVVSVGVVGGATGHTRPGVVHEHVWGAFEQLTQFVSPRL
jgi:hypothetical protein